MTIISRDRPTVPTTPPPQKKASIYIYVCVYVEILNFGPNTPPPHQLNKKIKKTGIHM